MDIPPISVVETQLMLGQIHLDHGRLQDAFMMFEAAARSGEPRAVNMLGRAYERGWGTACNPAAAAMYFHEAAYAGDPWAAFNLADLYMAGRGVTGDPNRACGLYVMAARGGVAKALTMLGLLAEDGTCAVLSRQSARMFFHAAAMGGDCWGALNLGRLRLAAGNGPAATHWIRMALEHGFSDVFRAIIHLLDGVTDPALRLLATQAAVRLDYARPHHATG
ncbi:sel1 repeat family protein [Komagataeibacter oboediens]|uniref:Sel1 repeat family protein n=1 Tax=Komagataeibacter oboediens TaxID=65958 RepID=A0A318R5L3_9PROT|nr:tetratricopeptide repeat protein [Komagataeibacter oboediens]PYD81433.1 sel1 repeat family protein [Komagataeibacter oboediens]